MAEQIETVLDDRGAAPIPAWIDVRVRAQEQRALDADAHPASLAVHAINNALQIVYGLIDPDLATATWQQELVDVRRLLEPVLEHVAALQQWLDVSEANVATMAKESVEAARQLDAEREKTKGVLETLREANGRLADASRDVEQLYLQTSLDYQRASERHHAVIQIRTRLDPSLAGVPHAVSRHANQPRAAAAGVR